MTLSFEFKLKVDNQNYLLPPFSPFVFIHPQYYWFWKPRIFPLSYPELLFELKPLDPLPLLCLLILFTPDELDPLRG